MIIGTGMDLVEINRISQQIHNKKFIERILTPAEQETLEGFKNQRRQEEFLAGRFAAKEAYAKARGTGIGTNLSWQDITILNDESGRPTIQEKKDYKHHVHLSITHTKEYAAAFVIIEGLSG